MPQTSMLEGLTTGHAPFVEEARDRGELYIPQATDSAFVETMKPGRHSTIASGRAGNATPTIISCTGLRPSNCPMIASQGSPTSTAGSSRSTGFQAAGQRLRPRIPLLRLPPPPRVPHHHHHPPHRQHGLPAGAGHLPRRRRARPHAPDRRQFADTLVRFGECAVTAAEITAGIRDYPERVRRLTSIMRAMSRFFWFTVEFGLMRGPDGVCAYGSGLLELLRPNSARHRIRRGAALPAPIGMGDQSGGGDRPLPAAAVRRRFVRPIV